MTKDMKGIMQMWFKCKKDKEKINEEAEKLKADYLDNFDMVPIYNLDVDFAASDLYIFIEMLYHITSLNDEGIILESILHNKRYKIKSLDDMYHMQLIDLNATDIKPMPFNQAKDGSFHIEFEDEKAYRCLRMRDFIYTLQHM